MTSGSWVDCLWIPLLPQQSECQLLHQVWPKPPCQLFLPWTYHLEQRKWPVSMVSVRILGPVMPEFTASSWQNEGGSMDTAACPINGSTQQMHKCKSSNMVGRPVSVPPWYARLALPVSSILCPACTPPQMFPAIGRTWHTAAVGGRVPYNHCSHSMQGTPSSCQHRSDDVFCYSI